MEEQILFQLGDLYTWSVTGFMAILIFIMLIGGYRGRFLRVRPPFTKAFRNFYCLLSVAVKEHCNVLCKIKAYEVFSLPRASFLPGWLMKLTFDFVIYDRYLTKVHCVILLKGINGAKQGSVQYYDRLRAYCDRAHLPLLIYELSGLPPQLETIRNEILTMMGVLPTYFEDYVIGNAAIKKDEDEAELSTDTHPHINSIFEIPQGGWPVEAPQSIAALGTQKQSEEVDLIESLADLNHVEVSDSATEKPEMLDNQKSPEIFHADDQIQGEFVHNSEEGNNLKSAAAATAKSNEVPEGVVYTSDGYLSKPDYDETYSEDSVDTDGADLSESIIDRSEEQHNGAELYDTSVKRGGSSIEEDSQSQEPLDHPYPPAADERDNLHSQNNHQD